MRFQEVGYPPHQTGLAFWKDWRGSYLYFTLIPSITEISALFVKELSFPQTVPTDDAFFNRNWVGACWDLWAGIGTSAGPVRWFWMLCSSAKISNKGGSTGARSLPLRCQSQFFPDERKDQLFKGRIFYVPFTDGVA